MPPRQATAGDAAAGQPEQSTFRRFFGIAQQIVLVYAVSQLATRYFAPKPAAVTPPPAVVSPGAAPAAHHVPQGEVNPFSLPPVQAFPAWPQNISVTMHVRLTSDPSMSDILPRRTDGDLPNFMWENITFGDWKESRVVDYEVTIPESVQNNGSLWLDVVLVKDSASLDPTSHDFDVNSFRHVRKLLTRYLPKPKARKEKKLLDSGDDEEDGAEEEAEVIISYWHQNLTLALVSDAPTLQYSQLPAPVHEHIELIPGMRDETGTKGYYKPIVFPNEFWHLRSQYIEINSTTPVLPLQIVFQPMTYFKFQMFSSMTVGFNEAAKQQGGTGGELDELKRILLETNPYYLGLTLAVSLLHMLFEMLAFSSDVSHWRKKDELTGVSVRYIVTNVFVQIVVLLYLLDNQQQTSWMILMTSGMGVLVEAWKITKAVDIKLESSPAGSILPYTIVVKDKHVLSEDEKKTQEYDKLAFRYVSYFTIPSLAIYTGYSLLYETHRGWYSFVISTLTSFVYMFGFAQLIPQLIINYKLKSVAHMPMKAMVYKSLSTVIDDLFAFIIKMPILHRLACFRDDVVFAVFLYQRWIYRVDPKRVNEYGQVLVPEEEETKDAAGKVESKKTK
ncbi:cleft lip and palate associated transmembrane protein [Stereum hirsutum FP-91666 SS1]|uniref:cleft lip and palate associated transmembrane protein n=1 Tax=Stereum hirsutum (strain FP-91666) TaxID=721885 RepID=UPI000444A7E4|nr:cleft lip and palate associated transmembrane protein [Stereum hirsutum FP-91666 SS1]EIM85601.1 cleft lip and palate associated transmembrane protein [Stereum hirsutum FP-91666 SS1]